MRKGVVERNFNICVYCGNKQKEVCPRECQPEGRYRHLEPEPLREWEQPPELPPFREMVDESPHAVRAIIWLNAHYRQKNNGDL